MSGAGKLLWSRIWLIAQSGALLLATRQLLQAQAGSAPGGRMWSCAYLLLSAAFCAILAAKLRRPIAARLEYWRRLLAGLVLAYASTLVVANGSPWAPDFLALTSASWLWLTAVCAPRGSAASFRVLRALELLATNVVIFLVVGELALRLSPSYSGQSLLIRNNIDAYRLRPHLTGRLHTNSLGYPSREFLQERRPGVQRIALVGDSFAVGVVQQDRNFASQIETLRRGTEVYNFGVSAIGPPEYYQLLISEVLDYHPDFVLLAFFVGNDIGDWSLQTPSLLSAETSSLYLFLYRTYRLLREAYRRGREGSSPAPWRRHADAVPMRLSRETYLQVELEHLRVSCPRLQPQYQASWRSTLGYLKRIQLACRKLGVPIGVLIIPDEYQTNPALLKEVLDFGDLSRSEVDLDLLQRRLRGFLADQGIPYLDVLPSLQGIADAYAPQDSHWNERGNRIAAQKIVEWLDRLLPPALVHRS